MADISAELDTAAKVAKLIGDVATAAMTAEKVILPILEDLAVVLPVLSPVANDIAVAAPYIEKVAQYAPVVAAALQQNKSLIEAVTGIGGAILSPLSGLIAAFPKLTEVSTFFAEVAKLTQGNDFTPQDPRFDRLGIGTQS